MGHDLKKWYDDKAETWSLRYGSDDTHFFQRLKNVDFLADELSSHSKMLDVGCASGDITQKVYERFNCHAVGVDTSERMISACKARHSLDYLCFGVADISALPFREEAFDLVLSLSVIEWVESYEKAICEVARVLKSGGQWIVSVPNWKSPLRKVEYIASLLSRTSYLHYQKNRLGTQNFERIARTYGLRKTGALFHVMPFFSGNLPEKIGPILGMMCVMSMKKML